MSRDASGGTSWSRMFMFCLALISDLSMTLLLVTRGALGVDRAGALKREVVI